MSTEDQDRQHPACATAVAGVASEVEALRTGLEPLRGLPSRVEELARLLTELAHQVRARVTRPPAAAAPSWLDLPADVDVAQQVLAELVQWLGEVYLRYADAARTFPDCWLWHPDVVEELLWLMVAWQAAYRSENATVALAGDWHDRYRPGVVRRIKATVGTCSPENHLPRVDRPGVGGRPVVPLAEAMEPIAAWWGLSREGLAPLPTPEQIRQAGER